MAFVTILKFLWLPIVIGLVFLVYFTTNPNSKKKKLKSLQLTQPEQYQVAGVSYHQDAVRFLLKESADWNKTGEQLVKEGKVGRKIYRYEALHAYADLQPEPENQQDKNAIKVIISGQHIGYIGQSENIRVGSILRDPSPKRVLANVYGGDYKVVSSDGEETKLESTIGAIVTIEPA